MWALTYRFIAVEVIFPPFPADDFFAAFHDRLCFVDDVAQQTELAGNEGAVLGVAGPSGYVDDVKSLVEKG